MKQLMTGNEAVARGAWEAGVHFAAAYPGTPSTEIMENLATYAEIKCEWSPNEKVAVEACCGASMAGGRALASMKHVGLNVAADPLFTYAYIGVNGGMVVVTADEPGQFSSQNEQDNRNYAKMMKIPMLEPSDSQECKDMIGLAFELSERFNTPVLFRLTTRVCHSKGIVECGPRAEVALRDYVKDVKRTVTVPALAIPMRHRVETRAHALADYTEIAPVNRVERAADSKIGVIVSGMCYYYAKEVFGDSASFLRLGFTQPLPEQLIRSFCESVKSLYVIEENDPYIEEFVKSLGFAPHGRDTFPYCGEMTPDVLRQSLTGKTFPTVAHDRTKVVARPPMLCAGCPHRGMFYELGRRKNAVISGDIGCYTLGFAAPYNAMDWNICMGASISAGHGAQQIFDLKKNETRAVAVIGDSTFFHTGMNSLLDVAYNGSRTITVILDNRITGMTGHQENPGSGLTVKGEPTHEASIESIVRALGIRQVRTINPNLLSEVRDALDWAFALEEASVIITRWPCVLKRFSDEDKSEFHGAFTEKFTVSDACIGCKLCLKAGCPALSFDAKTKKAVIDRGMCVGCTVCAQVCPKNAIVKEEK
ncbi:MAG: indolepyruvate ferredoxin oxidoreductase subunit alpha [Oscillospiraceae bacterium]